MAQTREGVIKVIARRIGINPEEVVRHYSQGEKWCWKCSGWKQLSEFGSDPSRKDGYSVYCLIHRRVKNRKPFTPGINPLTGHPGPAPMTSRDGDKIQARQRINVEVRTGRRPHPNSIPCTDCGHVWTEGERKHHYDHYAGYDGGNHYKVEAVCTLCHAKRDSLKKKQTHCYKGHEFTEANTIDVNGNRKCRECRRAYDRRRRDSQYWRDYRAKRKLIDG